MAPKAKTAEAVMHPPEWPTEVEGLADLVKAGDEAAARLELTRQRKAEAEAEMAAKVAIRDGLVQRAKAGKVVPGQEIAEVEAAIRAAESTAAILAEAIPGIEAEVETADKAVIAKVAEARKGMKEAAKEYLAAVTKKLEEAQRLHAEAVAFDAPLNGYRFGLTGPDHSDTDADLQRYAPDTYGRNLARRERKRLEASAPKRPRLTADHFGGSNQPHIMSVNEILQSRYGA